MTGIDLQSQYPWNGPNSKGLGESKVRGIPMYRGMKKSLVGEMDLEPYKRDP